MQDPLSLFPEGVLQLTPIGATKHSNGVNDFLLASTSFFFWIPPSYLSPLRILFFGDTGFDSFLSVEKAGLILAFVAQMMSGRPPAWKERMVWSIRRESCLINLFIFLSLSERYLRLFGL
jgi:hypothetical protein